MVREIEGEFETTVAGADSKFNMLQDKPNISRGGLRKVTNDQTALLRAEKELTRRVAEINKLRPMLENHAERKQDMQARRRPACLLFCSATVSLPLCFVMACFVVSKARSAWEYQSGR